MTKVLMRSVCVGAILAATGISAASAQQTIAPASATPVPGPMPEILQKYAPVTAERRHQLGTMPTRLVIGLATASLPSTILSGSAGKAREAGPSITAAPSRGL